MNNPICSCIFTKKSKIEFTIIVVYIDDLNHIRTHKKLTTTTNYLKNEFEMKGFRKIKFYLNLQIEHFPNGVLIYQLTYIKKILKRFHMNNVHHLSSSMVVQSLEMKNDSFCPYRNDKELVGPRVPYFSAIGALMYLVNYILSDMAFFVNLLARYNFTATQNHWNCIKYILHYLHETTNIGLFK